MRRRVVLCGVASLLLLGTPGVMPAAAVPDLEMLEGVDFRKIVREATDAVFPAVVYVKVVRESHASGERVSQQTSGSGVIISSDGEVLTNWHVIDKAIEVRCLTSDGQAFDAKVVGSDKDTDLALLKLDVPQDEEVQCAAFGDSDALVEGDFVMAMGAPWGMNRSVSIGIVSCTKRFLPEASAYSHWLQTDSAISPGNSGGPLVNTDGEIIGINSRGMTFGGDMGFAIPTTTIDIVVSQLREFGHMNWSWLGLQLQPIRDFDKNIYFDGDSGVIVSGTDPESPARRAGIQARDRLLTVNGVSLTALANEDLPTVRRILGLLPKHEPSVFEVERDGETLLIEVTPREKGQVEGEELDCPRWDLAVKEINQFDNPDLYFHRKEGVFVYGTKSPGNALNSGLRPDDIILKIDGESVASLDDVRAVHERTLEQIASKHRIIFVVLRSGLMQQVVLDFQRDYSKE